MSNRRKNRFVLYCITCITVCVVLIASMLAALVMKNKEAENNSSGMSTVDTSSVASSTESEATQSEESSSVVSSLASSTIASSAAASGLVTASKDSVTNDYTGEKVCYLTFDDGPCKNTEKILKILKDNDVKATFFVVGTMSTGRIKDIYDAGHAIGLHTNTHEIDRDAKGYIYKSVDSFINDVNGISDAVYKKIGIRSSLTRFPGGSVTAYQRLGKENFEEVKRQLKAQGYTYFDWNIDSGDTHKKSPTKEYVMNEIRKGLKSNGEYKKEVCILMHDIKNVTVEALPDIIKELKDAGYTFKSFNSNSENFAFK